MNRPFYDRTEAGQQLAQRLLHHAHHPDGVLVVSEVARTLQAPLDILLVRKLGIPGQEELAMGAIASGGMRIVNEEVPRSSLVWEPGTSTSRR